MINVDNETWILDAGVGIASKKAARGWASLSPTDRLTYCLWVADYGMRNAGDLAAAFDLRPTFLDDGRTAAVELGIPLNIAAFSLSVEEFEHRYFGFFDCLVAEIQAA